jgi:hypothetical protein
LNGYTVVCRILLVCLPLVVMAHRVPESLTTIRENTTTGNVEIVHRLHAHDAEIALSEALQQPRISLGELEAQAKLALYVEQRFQLADATTHAPIRLTLLGAALEGDYVLVFQETAIETLPSVLAVRNDVLRDAFTDQINRVNLFLGARLRTLIFQGEDAWKDATPAP